MRMGAGRAGGGGVAIDNKLSMRRTLPAKLSQTEHTTLVLAAAHCEQADMSSETEASCQGIPQVPKSRVIAPEDRILLPAVKNHA